MSAEKFADGSVAKRLHDWCETEDGREVCKVDGANGSIWGQDVTLENSLPTFTDIQSEKIEAFAYFYGADGLDSVQVERQYAKSQCD